MTDSYKWTDGKMVAANLGLDSSLEPVEQKKAAGFRVVNVPVAGGVDDGGIAVYAYHGSRGWLVELWVSDVLACQVLAETGRDLVECLERFRPLAT